MKGMIEVKPGVLVRKGWRGVEPRQPKWKKRLRRLAVLIGLQGRRHQIRNQKILEQLEIAGL